MSNESPVRKEDCLLRLEDVALMLQAEPNVIRKMVRRGEFPPPIEVGKAKRWLRSDLDAWLRLLSHQRWQRCTPSTATAKNRKRPAGVPESLSSVAADLVEECWSPAIYFLMQGGEVIYLGSSINPMLRVNDHAHGNAKTPPKEFDRAIFLPVDLQELIERERTLVAMLNPPLNTNLRTDDVAQRQAAVDAMIVGGA